MKTRILLLLVTVGVILSSASIATAQHQRLGIAPQSPIYLNGRNPVQEVEAFCLDRHKVIDGRYSYDHVLASNSRTVVTIGRRRLTLQQAIGEKLIKVSGQGSASSDSGVMSLRFERDLTKLPVKIEILDSLAMGENPGRFGNSTVLATLKTTTLPGTSRQTKQDDIWEADVDHSRLESLGYNSVEEFQRANNLPLRGLDAITKAKLREEEVALIARFDAIDLSQPRDDTRVKSVSDNIRLFQEKMGGKTTGLFTPDVRVKFERYEKVDFPIIRELEEYNRNYPRNALVLKVKSAIGDPHLYTVYSHRGRLYEGDSVSELAASLSLSAQRGEKIYLDLDFPSTIKAQTFKDSFDISQIKSGLTLIEGNPATKNVIFTSTRTFKIDSVTEPTLESGEYSSTIGLKSTEAAEVNKNWKVKARSKARDVVVKFTEAFKNLIGRKERQSLANILDRARAADATRNEALDVRLSFVDELGEIQLGKIIFVEATPTTAD